MLEVRNLPPPGLSIVGSSGGGVSSMGGDDAPLGRRDSARCVVFCVTIADEFGATGDSGGERCRPFVRGGEVEETGSVEVDKDCTGLSEGCNLEALLVIAEV